MLYRGDDLIRDIEFVIFDEIHYINDEERGLAYEEVLLLLPAHVGLIFLSATSPNKEEFAEWVGRVKGKPVHVLGTTKRPVPLVHYLFSADAGGLYLLLDAAGVGVGAGALASAASASASASDAGAGAGAAVAALSSCSGSGSGWHLGNYKAAAAKLAARQAKRGGGAAYGPHLRSGTGTGAGAAGRSGGGASKQDRAVWGAFLAALTKEDLLPAIVFCFSKKRAEECAFQGLGSADLTNSREKSAIHVFFEAATRRLSQADRALPQIQRLRGLLSRGIGVHHSGLLPIMKETVEILVRLILPLRK
jgi:antiviral helicase SKI2